MAAQATPEREPRPAPGPVRFEEGDFRALEAEVAGDPQFDDRRLRTRRKLLALAKAGVTRAAEAGLGLECRTSLHTPSRYNRMRVTRIWAYLTRTRSDKRRLRAVLGPELGKDLDAAYRNAYLCLGVHADALEVSLRIHPDAWYDGQNLANRLKREGLEPWRTLLNGLPGFRLRLHDWKGEWRCGELSRERLEAFVASYVPGDHSLAVERRFPAPEGARDPVLAEGAADGLLVELERLLPLYRFTVWSAESDHLFAGE